MQSDVIVYFGRQGSLREEHPTKRSIESRPSGMPHANVQYMTLVSVSSSNCPASDVPVVSNDSSPLFLSLVALSIFWGSGV